MTKLLHDQAVLDRADHDDEFGPDLAADSSGSPEREPAGVVVGVDRLDVPRRDLAERFEQLDRGGQVARGVAGRGIGAYQCTVEISCERPRERSSPAPMRVKMRSIGPSVADFAGTKLPQ